MLQKLSDDIITYIFTYLELNFHVLAKLSRYFNVIFESNKQYITLHIFKRLHHQIFNSNTIIFADFDTFEIYKEIVQYKYILLLKPPAIVTYVKSRKKAYNYSFINYYMARAITEKRVNIVKMLIYIEPDCVHHTDMSSTVWNAVYSGNLEIVKLLVENGANIQEDDDVLELTYRIVDYEIISYISDILFIRSVSID